jgi:hypothetical protein
MISGSCYSLQDMFSTRLDWLVLASSLVCNNPQQVQSCHRKLCRLGIYQMVRVPLQLQCTISLP